MPIRKPFALSLVTVLTASGAIAGDATLPGFDPGNFANPKANPYISLEIGARQVLVGSGTDEGQPLTEVGTQIVTGPGLLLMGVQTMQVLDESVKNGQLVERTFDYYATDKDGNLWYFGEDVTNYRYDAAGAFTGTDSKSAWRAGVNGALPGISVAGSPEVGMALFQEQAPEDGAMDYFEVVATDAKITGPAGTFEGVLKTFEGSTVEPELREFKYYVKAKGLIRAEEGLSEARDNPAMVLQAPAKG